MSPSCQALKQGFFFALDHRRCHRRVSKGANCPSSKPISFHTSWSLTTVAAEGKHVQTMAQCTQVDHVGVVKPFALRRRVCPAFYKPLYLCCTKPGPGRVAQRLALIQALALRIAQSRSYVHTLGPKDHSTYYTLGAQWGKTAACCRSWPTRRSGTTMSSSGTSEAARPRDPLFRPLPSLSQVALSSHSSATLLPFKLGCRPLFWVDFEGPGTPRPPKSGKTSIRKVFFFGDHRTSFA